MKQTPARRAAIGCGIVTLASALAAADPPPNGGPPHGPPQVAFDACANLTEGAACTVQAPDRTLTGTCVTFPDRGLACRPAGTGGPPRGA